MKRQARTATDIRDAAYRLALDAAREREKDGDPEGAGVIRDLAASIKRISLTVDQAVPAPLTIADLELNVRLGNVLGQSSPARLVGEVLDDATHPLRSKLRARDLKDLGEVRPVTSGAL